MTAVPVAAALACLLVAGCAAAASFDDRAQWQPKLSTGIDAYVHSYHLAVNDTTESLAEFNVAGEVEGRSRRATSHRWHLRGEMSAGTQLYRQLLDGTYDWRPDQGVSRLRADVTWLGRQYRAGSDYSLSSDNNEGLVDLRAYPWYTGSTMLDLRLLGRAFDVRTPSTLEQDYRDSGGSAFLRSRDVLDGSWRIGVRGVHRSYPDSSAIDRDVIAVEGDFDHTGDDDSFWIYHRSDHRLYAADAPRPSAWSHWTDVRFALPAGPGQVVTRLNNEIWSYEEQTGAYFDSWRTDVEFGYRWGDMLGTLWHALVTVDNLAVDDSPEAYTQVGLRGSFESYAFPFTGIVAVEYGNRWYRDTASDPDVEDVTLFYTDFTYLEVWIMATWSITDHVSFDLMANYQPENHTEQDDDIALGFGSARLVWRP